MFTVTRILHWVLLVYTSFAKLGGDFLGPPSRRLLWATPFVVILHPIPYFLLAALALAMLALTGRVSRGWLWFTGGFFTYALLAVLLAFRAVRIRRGRVDAASKASNNGRSGP